LIIFFSSYLSIARQLWPLAIVGVRVVTVHLFHCIVFSIVGEGTYCMFLVNTCVVLISMIVYMYIFIYFLFTYKWLYFVSTNTTSDNLGNHKSYWSHIHIFRFGWRTHWSLIWLGADAAAKKKTKFFIGNTTGFPVNWLTVERCNRIVATSITMFTNWYFVSVN